MNILYKLEYVRETRRFYLKKWNLTAKTWIRTTHYTGSRLFAGTMAVEANLHPDRV